MSSRRDGLTLIETIIAMLVFAVGALGLAATSAAVARQLTSSELRSRATNLANTREEKTNATACVTSSSADGSRGIVDDWTTTTIGSLVLIDQSVKRRDSKGLHTDRFLSAAPCD
jgi:prepilin-type N-terminal cleavage/methylation domain-containing protein